MHLNILRPFWIVCHETFWVKGHQVEPPSLCFEELSLSTDSVIDSISDVRALRGLQIQAEATVKLLHSIPLAGAVMQCR